MAGKVGRPGKYGTPKQLRYWVDQYFKNCERDKIRPKLTSMNCFLGVWPGYFNDKGPGFVTVIKDAMARVAKHYEDAIDSKQTCPALGIFMLKNCSYSDRVEISGNVSADISLSDMARQARAAAAR